MSLNFGQILLVSDIDSFIIDGVLENHIEMTNIKTKYPLEIGAKATDHAITEDIKYSLKGVVSNISTGLPFSSLTRGLDARIKAFTTVSSLALGEADKPAKALQIFMQKLNDKQTFSMFTGELVLNNLMITKLTRTKTESQGKSLFFEMEFEENKTLALITNQQNLQSKYLSKENALTQAAMFISKGQRVSRIISNADQRSLDYLRNSIGGLFR